jgi:hypothetical protein
MIRVTHATLPNSLILVMDQTVGKVPDSMNQSLVAATTTCVAVGTVSETDAQTFISLSDEIPPRMSKQVLAFDGVLPTPSRRLSVCSVHDDALLVLDVAGNNTRVRIWADHPAEPNEIWVVVGDTPA